MEPTTRLLRDVESLGQGARLAHVAAWTRRTAQDAPDDVPRVIADLTSYANGPHREHARAHLGLFVAHVARDVPAVAACLGADDPRLAGQAAVALTRLGPAGARRLAEAVDGLSPDQLTAAIRAARAAQDDSAARALYPEVRRVWGVRRAAALLPRCPAEVVADALDECAPYVPRALLAVRHPELAWRLVTDELASRITSTDLAGADPVAGDPGGADSRGAVSASDDGPAAGGSAAEGPHVASSVPSHVWRAAGADDVCVVLLERAPERWRGPVLDLIDACGAVSLVGARLWQRLAAADPTGTLDLATTAGASQVAACVITMGRRSLRRLARGLPQADLDALARALVSVGTGRSEFGWFAYAPLSGATFPARAAHAGPPGLALAQLLRALAPSERARVWTTLNADGAVAPELASAVLDELPHAVRHRQAAALCDRAQREGDLAQAAVLLGFLPYAEAIQPAQALTASADPELRAAGYRALIAAAGRARDPHLFARVLAELPLRNEAEPVRLQALDAIAAAPLAAFDDEVAGPLERIMTDAVEARDTSWHSASSIRDLAGRLLTERVDSLEEPLARTAIGALMRGGGAFWLPRLGTRLTRPAASRLVELFTPLIAEQQEAGRYGVLDSLIACLGERARDCPPLIDHLGELLLHGPVGEPEWRRVFLTAAPVWLADRAHRDERVRRLVAAHPDAAAARAAWPHVSRVATDLLTERVLSGQATGFPVSAERSGGPWLPDEIRGAAGWTSAQIATFGAYLATLTRSGNRELTDRIRAVRLAGALPDRGFDIAARAASHREVPVREAALAALAAADRPADAVTVLATRLDGDDARVAGYALGIAGAMLPRARFEALLRERLSSGRLKVTSRKAMILAANRCDLPMTLITDIVGERPHRDVVGAAVSAALRRPEDPAAWHLIETHLLTTPLAGQLLAGITPAQLPRERRAAMAAFIARLCDADPERFADDDAFAAAASDDAVRTAAFGVLHRWLAVDPGLVRCAYRAIVDPAATGVWQAAAEAARHAIVDHGIVDGWAQTIERLMALDQADPVDGCVLGAHASGTETPRTANGGVAGLLDVSEDGPQIDPAGIESEPIARWAWQRLAALTDFTPWPGRSAGGSSAAAAIAALATGGAAHRQLYRGMAVLLAVDFLPACRQPSLLAAHLTDIAALCDSRMLLAEQAAARLETWLAEHGGETSPDVWFAAAALLVGDGPGSARAADEPVDSIRALLVVRILAELGGLAGWPAPARATLGRLRAAADPDIAARAAAIGEESSPW